MVLVAPRNPLNIGAAARAMSNLGFPHLRLVNPYEVAYREARSAVKAFAVLERSESFKTAAEAVADCGLVVGTTTAAGRELALPLRRLEYGARLMKRELATSPAALLFGSEKFGLSNEDMSHCHWLMRIPTRQEHGSMNLGQSVAVCLYELIRSPAEGRRAAKPAAAAGMGRRRMFTDLLLEALRRSGYVNPRTAASTERKVRRLVNRLNLSDADASIWLGLLRQVLWRLEHPSS